MSLEGGPPQSWRWAGPEWTGRAPEHACGGVSGITIEVSHRAAAATRWASVLGLTVSEEGGTATIELEQARQDLRFAPAAAGRGEGITGVRFTTGRPVPAVQIGGVRVRSGRTGSWRPIAVTRPGTGTEDLLAEAGGGVAVLTMNRPDRRNAMSEAKMAAMDRVLGDVEAEATAGLRGANGSGRRLLRRR